MAKNTLEVCEKILDYFKVNPEAKVRPLSLSNEIGEDAVRVEKVLDKCKSFFLYLPTEQVYMLNKSSHYKGDIVLMKINAEDAVKDKNFFQKHWYLIILSFFVIATFILLSNMA